MVKGVGDVDGIRWERLPIKISGISDGRTEAGIARIMMPVWPEEAESQELFEFSVSRLVRRTKPDSKGGVRNHMIMLAGGPGQKGTFYFKNGKRFLGLIRSNSVALYHPSHRGTGKSSKFASSDADLSDVIKALQEKHSDANGLQLQSITVRNAAWDIVRLAELIKRGPDWIEGKSQLVLYGCSYGGLWATRVTNLRPDLFDWILLNSPFTTKYFWDPHQDRDLLKACQDDGHCRRQLGDPVENLRNAVSHVGQEQFNPCTAYFHSSFANLVDGKYDPELPRSHQQLRAFIASLGKSGPPQIMTGMAFINHMYKCPDVERFKLAFASVIGQHYFNAHDLSMEEIRERFKERRLRNLIKASKLEEAEDQEGQEDPDDLLVNLGRGNSVNDLVNLFILGQEMYGLAEDKPPALCQHPSPFGLANLCGAYPLYKKRWNKLMAGLNVPLTLKPDPDRYSPIKSSKGNLIIFHGALDAVTPLPAVEKFFHDCQVAFKRLLVQKNLGHGALFLSPCVDEVMDQIFEGSTSLESDLCLASEAFFNAPDWTFAETPLLGDLIWLKEPEAAPALPKTPIYTLTGWHESELSSEGHWEWSQTKSLIGWALIGFAVSFLASTALIYSIIFLRRIFRRERPTL